VGPDWGGELVSQGITVNPPSEHGETWKSWGGKGPMPGVKRAVTRSVFREISVRKSWLHE